MTMFLILYQDQRLDWRGKPCVESHKGLGKRRLAVVYNTDFLHPSLVDIGIWTKHLKAKTNLHQTVIDRCLKTLTQKRLIKRVPSVQVQ